jgi:hypothetical protein
VIDGDLVAAERERQERDRQHVARLAASGLSA